MADQHHETNPAMGNDISSDIPDILESIKFHWDVFGNFCGTLSQTDATGIYPGAWKRTSKTASYTVTDGDYWIDVAASSADVTLTLPAAATAGAGRYYIIKLNTATYECVIDGNGSETIDGEATIALTQTDETIGIICDGSNWNVLFHYSPKAASGKAPPLPRSYLAGLTLSNDTDTEHDINITAGECRDSTNGYNIVLESEITKQIDATWAAGNDAGGMNDGDAVGASEWFHVFLLFAPVSGAVDAGFDTDIDATNILADTAAAAAGFTKYRRIGSVLTDASSNILGFSQAGDEFLWDDPPLDVTAANPGTSAVTRTLSVPIDVIVWAHLNVSVDNEGGIRSVYFSPLAVDDEACSHTAAPLASEGGGFSAVGYTQGKVSSIRTNTSAQIRSRMNGSAAGTTLYIATLGWTDRRGRDD